MVSVFCDLPHVRDLKDHISFYASSVDENRLISYMLENELLVVLLDCKSYYLIYLWFEVDRVVACVIDLVAK